MPLNEEHDAKIKEVLSVLDKQTCEHYVGGRQCGKLATHLAVRPTYPGQTCFLCEEHMKRLPCACTECGGDFILVDKEKRLFK